MGVDVGYKMVDSDISDELYNIEVPTKLRRSARQMGIQKAFGRRYSNLSLSVVV